VLEEYKFKRVDIVPPPPPLNSIKSLSSERFFQPPFLPSTYLSFDPVSQTYSKRLKLEVSGEKTNRILWSIVIKDPNLNLPSDLPFAMLIHHGVPFQAEISVSARMGGGIRSALKESPGTWVVEFDGRTAIGAGLLLGKGKSKEVIGDSIVEESIEVEESTGDETRSGETSNMLT
jgi:hypothetical protein